VPIDHIVMECREMKRFFGLLLSLSFISFMGSAVAADNDWRSWELGKRLNVGVSLYKPSIDTKVVLGVTGTIQGAIDFEQNLGLDESKALPFVDVRWRMAKRHTLSFDYFDLDRSGSGFSSADITLCDDPNNIPLSCVDIPAGTESLNIALDVKVFEIGYNYSIIFNEKMDWSVGVGLSAQDFQLNILSIDDTNLKGDVKFLAPLPTLATRFDYVFADKWIVGGAFNWLDISADFNDVKFDGHILRADVGVQWQTFSNVGFFLNYTFLDLDASIEDGIDFGGSVEYTYGGPRLGINAYF
jgi:hypothetical protein